MVYSMVPNWAAPMGCSLRCATDSSAASVPCRKSALTKGARAGGGLPICTSIGPGMHALPENSSTATCPGARADPAAMLVVCVSDTVVSLAVSDDFMLLLLLLLLLPRDSWCEDTLPSCVLALTPCRPHAKTRQTLFSCKHVYQSNLEHVFKQLFPQQAVNATATCNLPHCAQSGNGRCVAALVPPSPVIHSSWGASWDQFQP
jgi:hypothetical protein